MYRPSSHAHPRDLAPNNLLKVARYALSLAALLETLRARANDGLRSHQAEVRRTEM